MNNLSYKNIYDFEYMNKDKNIIIDNEIRYPNNNTNNLLEYNNIYYIPKNQRKFDSKLYLNEIKNKIENMNKMNKQEYMINNNGNKFDIAKEKFYIKKSNGILENKIQKI